MGGSLKGFLVFCGVFAVIGLVGVALPYLDDRDKEFERRFVGALNFTDRTIEATLNLHAGLYEPSFARGSKPGHWAVSGLLVSKDKLGGTARKTFRAVVESLCSDSADLSCWRMVDLTIDGQAVETVSAVGSTPKIAAGAGASGAAAPDIELEDDSKLVPTLIFEDEAAAPSGDPFEATPAPAERPVEAVVSFSDEAAAAAQETAATGVNGGEPANAPAEVELSKQDLIRFIQDALTRLHYDPGPIDGKVGSRTASAIKAFQHDFNLFPDGRPTRELLRDLRGKLGDLEQQSGDLSNDGDQPSG